MQDRRAAKRYARALFRTALAKNVVPQISDDLHTLTQALKNSERFRKFLKSPDSTPEAKKHLFNAALDNKANPLTKDFIRLLVDKNRDEEILAVKLEFDQLRRDHENVTRALVQSAIELDQNQKDTIVQTIAQKTGRNLEPEFTVDPALIGGVKVTYGDYVLDGSVRGQLDKMKERLLYDLLKQA